MILSFIAVSSSEPIGGNAVIYEFAGAMADRGHEVHLSHTAVYGAELSSVEEIPWFHFDPRIIHHFPGRREAVAEEVPVADIVFGYAADGRMPRHAGLPVSVIQGHRMVGEHFESEAYHAPCPKLCVASWLVGVGLDRGVPEVELVHVPLGLRHEIFRVLTDPADRPRRRSFCYNLHRQKGADLAVEVCAELLRRDPELEIVAFGAHEPRTPLPEGITFRRRPPRDELVEEIYNGSQVFLCSSHVEGFGYPALEAMACGASLVTTDNGGSRDYAFHEQTALVSAPGDGDALVASCLRLLDDPSLRRLLSRNGVAHAAGFSWPASAEALEDFLDRYLADPAAFGRPPST